MIARSWCAAAAVALLAGAALAQRQPAIAYVFPAGMQRGTTVEVTVAGRNLQTVTAAHFARAGITAEVLEHRRPLTGTERATAQEKVTELQRQRREGKLSPADEATLRKLRQQIAESRRRVSPQLVESVRLRLHAADEAPTGAQDLRLLAPTGLSNPLRFVIGTLREQLEPADKSPIDRLLRLPLVVNGQILERDVDRLRLRAEPGTRLVAVVEARSLIPYLADAVPGWFQACLTLRDESGVELCTVDDCGPDPDPVLQWVVEDDGIYELELRDAVSRGREDFVYRVTIGELSYVESVFPLGAQAGEQARTMLRGANLDSMQAEVDLTEETPGVTSVDPGPAASEPLPFAIGACREQREAEPNDEQAQTIQSPVVINGIIDRPGDIDVYAIQAASGTRLVAEITARRLGSPLDSMLRLVDPQGNEKVRCDDTPGTAFGLDTQAADSRLAFTLVGSGLHHLIVSDVQRKGGAQHAYRLYIGPPRPDFALRVTPSTIALGAGGSAAFTAHLERRDGFDDAVALELVDAPHGWSLGGAVVPAGTDRVDLTVTAADLQPGEIVPLQLAGSARIKRREVRHLAVPCDDRMQAFLNRHLVPADQFVCVGLRQPRVAWPARKPGSKPLRLRVGSSAKLELVLPKPPRRGRRSLQFALLDPPEGIRITKTTARSSGYVLELEVDKQKELRGRRGNLILTASWQPAAGNKKARRRVGMLPAVPFQIAR